jgi:hypothetical protein
MAPYSSLYEPDYYTLTRPELLEEVATDSNLYLNKAHRQQYSNLIYKII